MIDLTISFVIGGGIIGAIVYTCEVLPLGIKNKKLIKENKELKGKIYKLEWDYLMKDTKKLLEEAKGHLDELIKGNEEHGRVNELIKGNKE